jgi:hypothetical protein
LKDVVFEVKEDTGCIVLAVTGYVMLAVTAGFMDVVLVITKDFREVESTVPDFADIVLAVARDFRGVVMEATTYVEDVALAVPPDLEDVVLVVAEVPVDSCGNFGGAELSLNFGTRIFLPSA